MTIDWSVVKCRRINCAVRSLLNSKWMTTTTVSSNQFWPLIDAICDCTNTCTHTYAFNIGQQFDYLIDFHFFFSLWVQSDDSCWSLGITNWPERLRWTNLFKLSGPIVLTGSKAVPRKLLLPVEWRSGVRSSSLAVTGVKIGGWLSIDGSRCFRFMTSIRLGKKKYYCSFHFSVNNWKLLIRTSAFYRASSVARGNWNCLPL